jgi:serine/threonine protein kinase/Cdc6-like AAA superfamily ATPase
MGLLGENTLDALGTVVAHFRLDTVLGEGGMGVVFKATDLTTDRVVALKVLKPDFARNEQFRRRFQRESRAAAAIQHPNIVSLYEAGESDDVLFLAMEWIDGATFGDLLKAEHSLPVSRVARVISQIAAGLDAAHLHGLIHRDVKPSNILLDHDDHAYLSDFGVALFGLDAERNITAPGQAVGSMDYMAPEMIRGEVLDGRVDIYCLGAVLFEALTGQPPFASARGMRILWAHLQEQPPHPSELVPGLSTDYDGITSRALAKDPADRYTTAGELADAVLRVRAHEHGEVAESIIQSGRQGGQPTSAPSASTSAAAVPEYAGEVPEPAVASPPADGDRAASVGSVTTGVSQSDGTEPRIPRVESRHFRIIDDFTYVHQALDIRTSTIPLLGNEHVANALAERIRHSGGGAFLVTGFRGVGKTTVITHAITMLEDRDEYGTPAVLPIFLNIARPSSTAELLFEVIRRLFEALTDAGVLARLAPDVQRKLILAYTRTSLSFKESRSTGTEHARSFGLSGNAVVAAISPKLDLASKTTDSLATEASFLAYSDADVEHDFLRIVSLFHRPGEPTEHPRTWVRRALRRRPRSIPAPFPWEGKVVVVIDELDKLTERDEGLACIEALLSGLKNLLNTTGVHFLFVAGPDLADVAQRHSHRGNSVYDSVFGWQLYVPCIWDATDRLLDAVMLEPPDPVSEGASLRSYLNFKSRGIPRLLLMELNSFVQWTQDGPELVLEPADLARIEFYAGLQRMLETFLQERPSGPLAIPIDEDRGRLGTYYITDRILKTFGTPFTVDDVLETEGSLSVDPMLLLSRPKVEQLLDHLVSNEILERLRGRGADETYFGDAPESGSAIFRVTDDVEAKLATFANGSEREGVSLAARLASGQQLSSAASLPGQMLASRYEILHELGRGGMARVYLAKDRLMNRPAAVKILDIPTLARDERVRQRFTRRAQLTLSLHHPNIADTYAAFTDNDGRPALAMEYVAGTSLQQLSKKSRMAPSDVVSIGLAVLDALTYLETNGLGRLDLKPSSIVLDEQMRPIIVDLGLAKQLEDTNVGEVVTQVGVIVGTPAYAAPEQLRGAALDIRADIYSLALIMCELISSKPVRADMALADVLATSQDDLRIDLPVSRELHDVLVRALRVNPNDRFDNPQDMRVALQALIQADAATMSIDNRDSPTAVTLKPGGLASLQITAQNLSNVSDEYEISVSGLPEHWWTARPANINLAPYEEDADQGKTSIYVQADRSAPPSAQWDFTVVARSRHYDVDVAFANAALAVVNPSPNESASHGLDDATSPPSRLP